MSHLAEIRIVESVGATATADTTFRNGVLLIHARHVERTTRVTSSTLGDGPVTPVPRKSVALKLMIRSNAVCRENGQNGANFSGWSRAVQIATSWRYTSA